MPSPRAAASNAKPVSDERFRENVSVVRRESGLPADAALPASAASETQLRLLESRRSSRSWTGPRAPAARRAAVRAMTEASPMPGGGREGDGGYEGGGREELRGS